ncbi:MAG: hypothetical protein RL338_1261 [Chloroflexota bacterium]
MDSRIARAAIGGILVLSLAACSGGSTSGGDTASPAASVPAGKVSANNASEEEIVAALEGAGVEDADEWAEEIVEYRPYADAEALEETLTEELAKYNPTQETLDAILSVLVP